MPKKLETPEEREAQLKAFQQAARELECDDDPVRFDERLKALARTPKGTGRKEEPSA